MAVLAILACTATGQVKASRFYLSIYFICFRSYLEIVFVKPSDLMLSPIDGRSPNRSYFYKEVI